MCYLIAKKFGDTGCLALQTSHGQHLADFKKKLTHGNHDAAHMQSQKRSPGTETGRKRTIEENTT